MLESGVGIVPTVTCKGNEPISHFACHDAISLEEIPATSSQQNHTVLRAGCVGHV